MSAHLLSQPRFLHPVCARSGPPFRSQAAGETEWAAAGMWRAGGQRRSRAFSFEGRELWGCFSCEVQLPLKQPGLCACWGKVLQLQTVPEQGAGVALLCMRFLLSQGRKGAGQPGATAAGPAGSLSPEDEQLKGAAAPARSQLNQREGVWVPVSPTPLHGWDRICPGQGHRPGGRPSLEIRSWFPAALAALPTKKWWETVLRYKLPRYGRGTWTGRVPCLPPSRLGTGPAGQPALGDRSRCQQGAARRAELRAGSSPRPARCGGQELSRSVRAPAPGWPHIIPAGPCVPAQGSPATPGRPDADPRPLAGLLPQPGQGATPGRGSPVPAEALLESQPRRARAGAPLLFPSKAAPSQPLMPCLGQAGLSCAAPGPDHRP